MMRIGKIIKPEFTYCNQCKTRIFDGNKWGIVCNGNMVCEKCFEGPLYSGNDEEVTCIGNDIIEGLGDEFDVR